MMSKISITTTLLVVLFNFTCVYGQVNQATLQPSTKDAHIISTSLSSTYNLGTLSCVTNRNSKTVFIRRGFIDFNLGNIPTNAIIIDAKLKLYRIGGLNSPSIEVSRVIETWEETGSTDVNWSNQPDVSLNDAIVTTPTLSNGFHVFDITNQVQEYVKYPSLNYGWRIKSSDENPGSYTCYDKYGNPMTCYESFGASYASNSYNTTSKRPILEVSWVLPIEVELVQINHNTSSNHSDGSIEINATKGGGNYTYEWIDGQTGNIMTNQNSKTLTGAGNGWYGVIVTDMYGNKTYMAFLIGTYCESTVINFDPGAKFIDDAKVYNLARNGIDYGDTYNGGASTTFISQNWTYTNWYLMKNFLRFRLNLNHSYDILSADVSIFGKDHWNHTGTNESEFNRVTADWDEYIVTWNTSPSSTNVDQVLLPATTSSTQNEVMDWLDFFTYWQNNQSENYGAVMQLQNPTPNAYRQRIYYSSDELNNPKPKLEIEIMVPCPVIYAKLEKKLTGMQYEERNGHIYFIVNEEYYDEDGELNYKIYNTSKEVVISSSGTTLTNEFGDNRKKIDVSSLNNDSWFVLEVTNDKNEVFKMRFKTN